MAAVRRLYIYLVSAISLQAVTWALIALARNLLIPRLQPPTSTIAFEIAVIIIGLPIFLVHWLWGQRLAGQDLTETEAGLRRFYLYATLAGFLAPFLANLYTLLLFWFTGRAAEWLPYGASDGLFYYHLSALLPLAVFWFYHQRILAADLRLAPDRGVNASIQRLYRLGFSTAGLVMVTLGSIHLLRRLFYISPSADSTIRSAAYDEPGRAATRLLIGLVLWLVFWLWSQRLFASPGNEERLSVLRKFYLYGWVLAGVVGAIGYATTLLAGILRRLLALPPQGDWRVPVPIIIIMGITWAYHAYLLRQDERVAADAPRQAAIRRIYLYLVAGAGLVALLVGLGGVISVFLRALSQSLGSDLREQLAWFTASVIAGLPIWLLNWRSAQQIALAPDEAGEGERTALTRKIYLYFFIFAATMTVLSGLVYIAYRIFSLLLGEPAPTLSELGQAIAFCLIAVGVWLYHGASLRADSRLSQEKRLARLQEIRVLLVTQGIEEIAAALLPALQRALPNLQVSALLPVSAPEGEPTQAEQVAGAGLIIAPWTAALEDERAPGLAALLRASPAPRLLLPTPVPGWNFAGVETYETPALVQQTVHAVSQIIAGQEVRPLRPLGIGAVLGIIFAALVGFSILVRLIDLIANNF